MSLAKKRPGGPAPDLFERVNNSQTLKKGDHEYKKCRILSTDPPNGIGLRRLFSINRQVTAPLREHGTSIMPGLSEVLKMSCSDKKAEARLLHLAQSRDTPTDPHNLQRKAVIERYRHISRHYGPISLKGRIAGSARKSLCFPCLAWLRQRSLSVYLSHRICCSKHNRSWVVRKWDVLWNKCTVCS